MQINAETTFNLQRLKPLTTSQFDVCKAKSVDRVQKRIGERPTRKKFEREHGRNWTILDILAVIIFIAALAVSSVHIIEHMGKVTATVDFGFSGFEDSSGIVISPADSSIIHQVTYVLLAESAMLLFLTMWALQRRKQKGIGKFVSISLILAIIAAVFVVIANWQSGIGLLESAMPPLFTIGIGFHLEGLIVQGLERRTEVDERYTEAMNIYEAAMQDPTTHPDYLPILKQEIWQKLISLKANQQFIEAPPQFKHAAVEREMDRDRWAYAPTAPVTTANAQPQAAMNGNGVHPNGNGHSPEVAGGGAQEEQARVMAMPGVAPVNRVTQN